MNKNYIPGVCNIGEKEISIRRFFFLINAFFTVNYFMILTILRPAVVFYIPFFILLFFTIINFLQYRFKFCVKFAAFGAYNFSDKTSEQEKIMNLEFLIKDRIKAIKMLLIAFVSTVIISSVVLILR